MSRFQTPAPALRTEDVTLSGDLGPALAAALAGREAAALHGEADDGLLWGAWTGERLVLAPGAALDARTLLHLRVFGERAELRVRRSRAGLRAAWVLDGAPDPGSATLRDAHPLLRRDKDWAEALEVDGLPFVRLRGAAGEAQVVPGAAREPWLRVRHHLRADPETGAWRLFDTRWLGVGPRPEGSDA